jgi:hypothetical protein
MQVVLVLALFLAQGCSPEKARALKAAAVQFKLEALAAINAVDGLMRQELEPPPRSTTAANDEFIANVLSLPAKTTLTSEIIALANDPYTVQVAPAVAQQRDKLLNGLRVEYAGFAAIFDDLERGSVLARDAVRASAKHAERLTAQMSALAVAIDKNPPHLLQYETALLADMERVRGDKTLSADTKRKQLLQLKEQWAQMQGKADELRRTTVEQCLKAAVLGKEVRQLIDRYGELSLEDLNSAVALILEDAGAVSGNDYSALQAKSAALFAEIKQDPIWTSVADSVLGEVNQALASPSGI